MPQVTGMKSQLRKTIPIPLQSISIAGGFWGLRIERNHTATIPAVYEQLKQTGRIDAWKLVWSENAQPNPAPHYFWDSDVAKWIEAAAYSLATHPDETLEARVDAVIALIEPAQQRDGYLNIHFTAIKPEERWQNLRDHHELYCAGHLIEAAIAYFEATGKHKLLDILIRYADHIDRRFGPNESQVRGYPGHQEIELALVKLYRVTGEARYLRLAKFFIDERGQQPHYYDIKARERGEDPASFWAKTYEYNQSHIPVREQVEAVGHAVRGGYMYAGMADVAIETGDETLKKTCKRLWRNLTQRRMYVTGGVGSTNQNEGHTFDYDLPNETGFAETCASIALVFWAHRMLQLEPDGQYADVMECALYNGFLSSTSHDGRRFFYANPLAAYPGVSPRGATPGSREHYRRQEWYTCACCPPNIARLLASLGQYIYSTGRDEIYVHLYVQSTASTKLGERVVQIEQTTDYPRSESVHLAVRPNEPAQFTLALRVPGWCCRAMLKINGEALDVAAVMENGYAKVNRMWHPGGQIELTLPMEVKRIKAHPSVRQNVGQVALQRGPVVYCIEEIDNGPDLASIILPRDAELTATFDADLLGGAVVITGKALRATIQNWEDRLYRASRPTEMERVPLKAIPYSLWANREPSEMRVWIREC
jgi:DUF1680 family protein